MAAEDIGDHEPFIHLRLVQLFRWKKSSPNSFGFSVSKVKSAPTSPTTESLSLSSSLRPPRKERNHLVTTVQVASPAYFSGLREMDHLIQVNGEPVNQKSQKTVGQMIRESEDVILLLVCDDTTFKHIKDHEMPFEASSREYPVLFVGGTSEPPLLENISEWRRRQGVARRFSLEASPILRRKRKE